MFRTGAPIYAAATGAVAVTLLAGALGGVMAAGCWSASPGTINVTGGTGGADTGGSPSGDGTGGATAGGSGGRIVGGGAGGTLVGPGGTGGDASCAGQPPPASELIGWASQPGMGFDGPTTGGGTATPIMATSNASFNNAIAGTAPAVVYLMATLTGNFNIGSNKTVVGLCGGQVHGHIDVRGSSNVIVRNLKIVGYGVGDCSLDPSYDVTVGCSSGADAVTIQSGAHHVWFDHDDISDGTDGNLDVVNGSDFVTISWTKFHYTPRTDPVGNDSTGPSGHRFSNLIGSADNLPGDAGHLNITWHHDWWADNVNQRMPRSRDGKIHMLNNLFTAVGDSYCTNAGVLASLLVEGNVYSGVRAPLQPATGGDMLAPTTGPGVNLFLNTSGLTTTTGVGFVPPYAYTPDPASTVAAAVMAGAGPQ